MIQSMTGFGRATGTFGNKKITVEVRTLNSKGIDIYLRVPNGYKSFEVPIRKLIGEGLQRGKAECFVTVEPLEGALATAINKDLFLAYYREIEGLAEQVAADKSEIINAVMRIPEVMHPQDDDVSEEEWAVLAGVLSEALEKTIQFRTQEGQSIVVDFENSIGAIERLLLEVPKYEEGRIESVRERMAKALEKLQEPVDKNRFEQELIYYIEKLDINEEKSRLQHHLAFFRKTMNLPQSSGKKLGFITQEIGREINTLGSKSYQVDLQKIVVEMKDYLEKIKEQVSNAL